MKLRNAPWTVAPLDRSIAQRLDGMMPKAIARLRTDGGTTFCIKTNASDWHPDFRKTFEWLVNQTAEQRRARKTNPIVGLPVPSVPGRGQGDAFATDDDSPDPRMLGWADAARDNPFAPRVPVEAWVTGGDTPCLHFHAADRMFVTMYQRTEPAEGPGQKGVTKWECRVQCKARELYADGLNLWMVRWLGLWGWLLAGRYCLPSEAHALGWRTTQWHVNSDFTGLHMLTEDAWKVCGWLSGRAYGDGGAAENRREASAVHRRELAHIEEFKKANPNFANTLYLGRLTSDTCLVVYKKTEQLADEKQVEAAASMYAPEWRANGWDGHSDITRVELRLRKKALIYVDPESHDVLFDFRDPAMLLKPEARRHVWQYVTSKRRLTCPANERSRLTRAMVDPAWMNVIRLGYDAPNKDIRQIPRNVRALTRQERLAKSQHQAMLAAVKFAAQNGAALKNWREVGEVLVAVGNRMRKHGAPAEMSSLPRIVDVAEAGDYAVQTSVFFRGEADAAYEDFVEEVGIDLEPIEWSKALGKYGDRLRRFLAKSVTREIQRFTGLTAVTRDFWDELQLAASKGHGEEADALAVEAVAHAIEDHLPLGPTAALDELEERLADVEIERSGRRVSPDKAERARFAAELEGLFYDALRSSEDEN